MGRKPKPGPAVLRVEGLSDGRDPRLVDDFTGEPIAQPEARVPKIANAQDQRDAENRAKAKGMRAVAELALAAIAAKREGPSQRTKAIAHKPFKRRV